MKETPPLISFEEDKSYQIQMSLKHWRFILGANRLPDVSFSNALIAICDTYYDPKLKREKRQKRKLII